MRSDGVRVAHVGTRLGTWLFGTRSGTALRSRTGGPVFAGGTGARRSTIGFSMRFRISARLWCFHARLSHKAPPDGRCGRRTPESARSSGAVPFEGASPANCGTPAHANPFVRQPLAEAEWPRPGRRWLPVSPEPVAARRGFESCPARKATEKKSGVSGSPGCRSGCLGQ